MDRNELSLIYQTFAIRDVDLTCTMKFDNEEWHDFWLQAPAAVTLKADMFIRFAPRLDNHMIDIEVHHMFADSFTMSVDLCYPYDSHMYLVIGRSNGCSYCDSKLHRENHWNCVSCCCKRNYVLALLYVLTAIRDYTIYTLQLKPKSYGAKYVQIPREVPKNNLRLSYKERMLFRDFFYRFADRDARLTAMYAFAIEESMFVFCHDIDTACELGKCVAYNQSSKFATLCEPDKLHLLHKFNEQLQYAFNNDFCIPLTALSQVITYAMPLELRAEYEDLIDTNFESRKTLIEMLKNAITDDELDTVDVNEVDIVMVVDDDDSETELESEHEEYPVPEPEPVIEEVQPAIEQDDSFYIQRTIRGTWSIHFTCLGKEYFRTVNTHNEDLALRIMNGLRELESNRETTERQAISIRHSILKTKLLKAQHKEDIELYESVLKEYEDENQRLRDQIKSLQRENEFLQHRVVTAQATVQDSVLGDEIWVGEQRYFVNKAVEYALSIWDDVSHKSHTRAVQVLHEYIDNEQKFEHPEVVKAALLEIFTQRKHTKTVRREIESLGFDFEYTTDDHIKIWPRGHKDLASSFSNTPGDSRGHYNGVKQLINKLF